MFKVLDLGFIDISSIVILILNEKPLESATNWIKRF